MIWHFLGVGIDDGRLITSRLDIRPKSEMINSLAARYVPAETDREKIKSLTKRIEKLAVTRNLIIHGIWMLGPDDVAYVASLRKRSSAGDMVAGESFPLARFDSIINDITVLASELGTLLVRLASPRWVVRVER